MHDLFVATIVLGVLPFVLKRPFLGVLLMAWLGYMNPHRLCYGFMLSFPVVQTVAIFTLAGMLISKEAKRLVWSREVIALLAFVVWMGVSTILAFYPGLALIEYERFVKIQILTFMNERRRGLRQVDEFLVVGRRRPKRVNLGPGRAQETTAPNFAHQHAKFFSLGITPRHRAGGDAQPIGKIAVSRQPVSRFKHATQ